jgi:heat shock protein HslJ
LTNKHRTAKGNVRLKAASFLNPLLALSLACFSCVQSGTLVSRDTAPSEWSLASLKNATYSGLTVHPDPVTLVDGRWEGGVYVQGGAARPSVHFVGDLYRIGKISGIADDAAVVFLSESSGGSGTFLYLAVVEKKNGTPVNTATAPVGDRVQIRDVRIENETIAVDVLQAGPQDAACCPGELATRHWQLAADQLVEAEAPAVTGRLSLDGLAGDSWTLRAWSFDEPAPDAPEITLVYDNGRFSGSAGCNRYFASVMPGDHPGDLMLGPSGSTRMICPQTIMAAEHRFLNQLYGVKKMSFLAGQLALSFEMDGKRGTMRFNRNDGLP